MDYSFLHRRYDGRLLLGLVDTKLLDCRPFAWMTCAEFSLGKRLRRYHFTQWNSGHSHFSASGQITDFRHPHLQGSYDAQLDLTEAASIARRRDLRAGVLELKGTRRLVSRSVRRPTVCSLFAISPGRTIRFLFRKPLSAPATRSPISNSNSPRLQGRIFGGSFTGDAELNQWLAPEQHLSPAARKNLETAIISAAPPPKSRKSDVETLTAQATGNSERADPSSSARSLCGGSRRALNVPAHPACKFFIPPDRRPAPRDSLEGNSPRCRSPIRPRCHSSRASTFPGNCRISAHANGVYHAATNTLDLPQFTLTTPTSHVQASGTLSAASAVRLSVSTSSLADWLPFLSVVRGPALFPVVLNGSATFTGNMSGSFVFSSTCR